jgi:VanW like protein/glycosyl transferase family 1
MKELASPGRMEGVSEKILPTRRQAIWFEFRAACFRGKRALEGLSKKAPKRLKRGAPGPEWHRLADSRTVLFNSASPAEFALQAGKVQNLRIAARTLNGTVIRAGEVFSLWKNLGRASRRRGFVVGRELREGCVIPNVGGGLCQLSNALYDVALRSGCEIVERHAHTEAIPGSTTAPGRDATIFWNYVDFRFRPGIDCQLRVELSRGELTVALHSLNGAAIVAPVQPPVDSCETRVEVAETCETCAVTQCFRNPSATSLPRRGITAFLVDKFEPEFDRWMAANHEPHDVLFVPMKSDRLPAYAWRRKGFSRIHHAFLTTLRRSWRSRRLAAQGPARQRALLESDAALAQNFSRKIPHLADHLVVSQNLLPHLWRTGALGGRAFDVLMTRLPMAELEKTLDAAAQAFPQSRTLADFRAPSEIREAETEALGAARFWITPHSAIAKLAGSRALKLNWYLPSAPPRAKEGGSVIFPASTLARKGCYEVREVAGNGGIASLGLLGPVIEEANFWGGIAARQETEEWLSHAAVVVLPAWVEHWPRRLLRAAAAGVPVIASTSCGLAGVPNVTEISPGDVASLRDLVARHIR